MLAHQTHCAPRFLLRRYIPVIGTGFDKGVVTHVRSFNEYVDDLESFVSKEVAPRVRATRLQGDKSPQSDKIIYLANSVAGMYCQ